MFCLLLFFFIVLGAVLGSFATAITHRIPQGKSWISDSETKAARSKCPKCNNILGALDLVPILSWLFLRGRCRYCRTQIPAQYIQTEVFCSISAVTIYLLWGVRFEALFLLCLLPFAVSQSILFYQNRVVSLQLCFIMVGIIGFYIIFKSFI